MSLYKLTSLTLVFGLTGCSLGLGSSSSDNIAPPPVPATCDELHTVEDLTNCTNEMAENLDIRETRDRQHPEAQTRIYELFRKGQACDGLERARNALERRAPEDFLIITPDIASLYLNYYAESHECFNAAAAITSEYSELRDITATLKKQAILMKQAAQVVKPEL